MNRNEQGILLAPARALGISEKALWLAGQGSGSWYELMGTEDEKIVQIKRYSPTGFLEFDSRFELQGNLNFTPKEPYSFDYPSHFKHCTLVQHGQKFKFVNCTV